MSDDDLAERLRRLDHRYIAELVRERAQFVDRLDDLARENEELIDYGLEMLARAMKAGRERDDLRRQVAAVLALCERPWATEWSSGVAYDLVRVADLRAALRQ